MNEMEECLIIFVKNTEKGKVKTRLAKTIGDDAALLVYKALLKHTRQTVLAVKAKRFLFYSQYVDVFDDWQNQDFLKLLQKGNSLGERIIHAFQDVFEKKPGSKVIIIGSDCPQLSPEILKEAYKRLDDHSFVIGPAADGGYYLLGMRKFEPSLFKDIAWSTDSVLKSTQEKIKALSASHFLLPVLSDIDREEDWTKHGWKL